MIDTKLVAVRKCYSTLISFLYSMCIYLFIYKINFTDITWASAKVCIAAHIIRQQAKVEDGEVIKTFLFSVISVISLTCHK